MRAGLGIRLRALGVSGIVITSLAFVPSLARSATINLFDDSGTAYNPVSGNATQGLDTTVEETGTASWRITDTGVTQDFFSVSFTMNDHSAPLSALNPATGNQLWIRYLTSTSDFRVRFSLDVFDDTYSAYEPIYTSGASTQMDLLGGGWRTAMIVPTSFGSTFLNQTINRNYRLTIQSWPSGSGYTQSQGSTINIDRVMLVPEPATLSAVLGASAILLVRRRRA